MMTFLSYFSQLRLWQEHEQVLGGEQSRGWQLEAASSCCPKLPSPADQSEPSMGGNQPIRGQDRHEARAAAPFPGMFPPPAEAASVENRIPTRTVTT